MLFENNNAKLTGKNTALVFFLTKGLHRKREAKLFSTVVLKNTFDRLLLNFMKKLYYKNLTFSLKSMEVIKSQVDAYLHGTLSCEIIQQLRNSYMDV